MKNILKNKAYNKSVIDLRNTQNEYILQCCDRDLNNLFIDEGFIIFDNKCLNLDKQGLDSLLKSLFPKNKEYAVHFKNYDEEVIFSLYDEVSNELFTISLNKKDNLLSELDVDKYKRPAEALWNMLIINRCTSLLTAFNNIAINSMDNLREVKYVAGNSKSSSNNKKKNKKSKKVVIVKKYILANVDYTPTRTYQRHIEGWEVRGHYRTLKSGKKVWIKPSVRGNKKNIENKTYVAG